MLSFDTILKRKNGAMGGDQVYAIEKAYQAYNGMKAMVMLSAIKE